MKKNPHFNYFQKDIKYEKDPRNSLETFDYKSINFSSSSVPITNSLAESNMNNV